MSIQDKNFSAKPGGKLNVEGAVDPEEKLRYPESRPAEMLESVRRLLQLGASGQVDVVLPGHNQVNTNTKTKTRDMIQNFILPGHNQVGDVFGPKGPHKVL